VKRFRRNNGEDTNFALRAQIEHSLLAGEEIFPTLLEQLPAVVFLDAADAQETTLYISQKIKDLLGYTPEEWKLEPHIWEKSLHPEDRQRVIKEDRFTRKTGAPFQVEYRLKRKDGGFIWVHEESVPIKDGNGTTLFWQGFLIDITEKKQAEEIFRKSEALFSQVFYANPIASSITTLEEGYFVDANRAYWTLTGFSPEEVIGRSVVELGFLTSRQRSVFLSKLKKEQSIKRAEGKFITKNGKTINTLEFYDIIQLGGEDHILSNYHDMTDQMAALQALKESEASYRGLFNSVNEAIYIQDSSGKFLDVNEGAVNMYGHPREFFIGKTPEIISAPGRNNLSMIRQAGKLAFKGEAQHFEFWGLRANGEVFPKDVHLYKGNYFGQEVVLALAQDITERKKNEEALRKNEELLRSIIDHTTNAFYSHTPDNTLTYVSAQVKNILGYEPEEALQNWHTFLSDHPINSRGKELTQKAIETGKQQQPYNLQLITKDNQLVWVEVRESPVVRDGKTIAIIGALADITERVAAEETLRKKIEELIILHRIATASAASQNMDELIERITNIIGDSLNPDNCGVELVTGQGDAFIPHRSYRGALVKKTRRAMPLSTGVVGKVITSGQTIRLGDVTQEPAYIEATPKVKSELCVPIKIRQEVIGAFNIESKYPNAFTEADERLLDTIADNLATAIEKLHLLENEQKRRQEAELLLAATNTLTTSLNLESLYDAILENLCGIVTNDSASITLMVDTDLVIVAGRNLPSQYRWVGKRFPGSAKWEEIFSNLKLLIISDTFADPRFEKWEGTEYIRSWMGIPLILQGKLIGLLNLDSRKVNSFNTSDAILVQTFANSAAVAIENVRLFEIEQKRRQEAETLQKATAIVTTTLDQEMAIKLILEQLSRVVTFDSASIQLLRDGYMEIVGGQGSLVLIQEKDRRFSIPGNNPNTTVIQQRRPLLLKNAPEAYPGFIEMPSIKSWLGVPLIVHDRVIGLLTLDSNETNHFTEEQAQLVGAFANQAAIAIENARLFETEKQRRREAEMLRQASKALTSSLDLNEVLNTLLQQIAALIPYNSAAVFIQEKNHYRVVTGHGFKNPERVIGHTFPLDDELASIVRTSRQPIISQDIQNDSRFQNWGDSDGIHGWMCFPLLARDQVIGHLTIDSLEIGAYNKSDAELAMAFANQAATAIENARLFETERQRHRESETLRQAAMAINTSLDIESVLDTILSIMRKVIPYDSASVLLLDEDFLRLAATNGFPNPKELYPMSFPADDELFKDVRVGKKPVILMDAQNDARFKNWANTDYVRSWMGIPLTVRKDVIGCITLDNRQPDAYDSSLADLAQSFANQAASAILNARQFEAEQRHFQEAESLRITAESITSSLNIRQVLEAVLDNLSFVISYDSACIFLLEGELVRLTAAKGLPGNDSSISLTFPASNPLLRELIVTQKPLILDDAQEDSRFERWVAAENIHGWMGVPLVSRGETIGFITIDSLQPRTYNSHAANLATTFAHQAAAAIENARLFERSEKQVRKLTVLRDIDTAISASFDLKVTLNILLANTNKELNAQAAAILLYTPSIQALSYFTGVGFTGKYDLPKTPIRLGSGLVGQVALQRKLNHISDLPNQPEGLHGYFPLYDYQDYIGVPLINKGQIQGVLELYFERHITPDMDWLNFLEMLAGQAAIAIDNAQLFTNLQRSNQELILAYDTTLEGWGKALELRDKETQGHTQRVSKMTINLARRLGIEGEQLTHILRGTLLHDIGKMGIPDQILHKPGPLNEEEWEIMRQHPKFAYDLLSSIPYLRPALDIPYCHHERWDGSGYPRGMKGEEIPLSARIFAIVDIWDALLYDRPYRKAWEQEKVIQYIRSKAGTELDPKIVDVFLLLLDEMNE